MGLARVLGRLAATLLFVLAFAGYVERAEAHAGHGHAAQTASDAVSAATASHEAVSKADLAAAPWQSRHCDEACGHCCPATSTGTACSMACAGMAGVLPQTGLCLPPAAERQIAPAAMVAAGLAPSPDPHPPRALPGL